DQVDRAAADRAGAAEDRNAPGGRFGGRYHHPIMPPTVAWNTASTGAAAISPSIRSSMPPCPGISRPLSLTPNFRLIADSNRSPPWATAPSTPASAAAVSGIAALN